MKKLLLLSALFITSLIFAQIPQGVSYQAIAMNGSGNAVANANVGLRLSILNTSATGTVVYSETQTKMTNAQGLFNLVIGQGTPLAGTFAGIDWATGSKFLKVEMDVAGGTNYALVGTTQLLSVPYAMAAGSLVAGPGSSITLTSPNGTPFELGVNDNGELSLPTSNQPVQAPSNLYLYGSFNGWNASSALAFGVYGNELRGFKYMTAGTQVKFLGDQTGNTIYGGNGLAGQLVANGNPITIPSNGFYRFNVANGSYTVTSINVSLWPNAFTTLPTMTYNVAGNYFNAVYNQGASNYWYRFVVDSTGDQIVYGDNLTDGFIEVEGAVIAVAAGGSKNFKLYLNFDGYGTYTLNAP